MELAIKEQKVVSEGITASHNARCTTAISSLLTVNGRKVEAERQSALPVRNERAQAKARPILRKVQKTILVVGLLRGEISSDSYSNAERRS